MVRITVVTMFPGYFEGPLATSLLAGAIEEGAIEVDLVDLRRHGLGRHRQLDDAPFGGGPGMVMRVEPLAAALDPLSDSHRILLSAAGHPVRQETVDRWATKSHLTLVCGRFEGVDNRVAEHLVSEEAAVGDFVVSGGEAAALMVIEGVARLVPGVMGNPASVESESFRGGLLEEPVYTRPAEFRGWEVPAVLLSGDHARIDEWRSARRVERTRERRPEMLGNGNSQDT